MAVPPSAVLLADGPRGRLARIRHSLTPAEWTRMGGMALTIVILHVAGWGMLAVAVGGHYRISSTEVFGFGTGILAYTLGMRHAFDADHIAAIDNTTRKLVGEGKRPLSVGFCFSLGHSSVVFVAGGSAELRHPRARPAGQQRRFGTAHVDRHHRHRRLRHVPVPDRRAERRHPDRHRAGVQGHAHRPVRRRRARAPSWTSAG